jgi:uncharacterized membrane protein YeaQ/YmgE (transglycosylase-associated protein family)
MFSPSKSVPPVVAGALLLAAGCAPALAQGYDKASSFPGMDRLVSLIGYDGLHGDQRDLLGFALFIFGLGFGYFSHLGFRESGFGIVVNGLIGLVGTCLALLLLGPKFGFLSQYQGRAHDFLVAVLCAGAAVPTLMLASLLARLFRGGVVDFFYKQSRRTMDAERAARVQPELPPRILDALRK